MTPDDDTDREEDAGDAPEPAGTRGGDALFARGDRRTAGR